MKLAGHQADVLCRAYALGLSAHQVRTFLRWLLDDEEAASWNLTEQDAARALAEFEPLSDERYAAIVAKIEREYDLDAQTLSEAIGIDPGDRALGVHACLLEAWLDAYLADEETE
jgi:hypothetical protein